MKRNEVIIGIPEFGTSQVRWVITLPQFTIINVRVEIAQVQQEGNRLEADSNVVANAMKQEISQAVTNYLNPKAQSDAAQRQGVQIQYDSALTRVSSAINEIQAAGGDPAAVPDGKGGTTNLRATYDDLTKQRADALQKLDEILQESQDSHMASF